MASVRSLAGVAVWSGRALEWAVLLVVILLVIGIYGRQSSALQAQAELATVQSTLGALRTSLVVDHLQQQVRVSSPSVAPLQRNPFSVLDMVPLNYAGEVAMSDLASVSPGSWVFDKACPCIGYRPQNPQALEPSGEFPALWFRVSGAPGPLQLTPLKVYRWRGQTVN